MSKQQAALNECPAGYFWNGRQCVPRTTPPPDAEPDPNGKKVEDDKEDK